MEEFWIGVSVNEQRGIRTHSTRLNTFSQAVEWCEKTMRDDGSSFYILRATHSVRKPSIPVEVEPLQPKQEKLPLSMEEEGHPREDVSNIPI